VSNKNKLLVSINRRRVLQLMAAMGTATMFDGYAFPNLDAEKKQQGYGPDVDMNKPEPTWEKSLTENQLKNLRVLGDIIISADETSPAAGELNIADFINEWVSAPYPVQQQDREIIITGLKWLDKEAGKQQVRRFHLLSEQKQVALFDHLAVAVKQGQAEAMQEKFFERLVYLFVGGYYTTREGMADIGYTGNVPLTKFDGPPAEVRRRLGV